MWRLVGGILVLASSSGALGADYARAGALVKDGKWEVGVVFEPEVSRESVILLENFIFGDAQVQVHEFEYIALNHSVILTVTGLVTNHLYSLTLTNMQSSDGSSLPPSALSFRAKPISWTAVGGQELGFEPEAVAAGDVGFDLISGGVEMWGRYDESTFVHEEVTGDFDKRVRVESQEPSSEFARAGLMVRENLDAGKARPADPTNPAEAFSRYLQVHVTPVTAAFPLDPETSRTNLHQVIARLYPGGIGSPNFDATEVLLMTNVPPPYPNAWLRLARAGETFHVFHGEDGTNWTRLGSFTFPRKDASGLDVPPFSQTVFVGPNYSPEAGNIPESSGARRAFLARFRDYGDASGPLPGARPNLDITRSGAEVQITWTGGGTLESSTDLAAWSELAGASPFKIAPSQPRQYFRVRVP